MLNCIKTIYENIMCFTLSKRSFPYMYTGNDLYETTHRAIQHVVPGGG